MSHNSTPEEARCGKKRAQTMAESYDYDLMREVCVTEAHHITLHQTTAGSEDT